jgi:hypothetical protein
MSMGFLDHVPVIYKKILKVIYHGKLSVFGGAQRARRKIMLVCHFPRRARLDRWDISPHFGLNNHFKEILLR